MSLNSTMETNDYEELDLDNFRLESDIYNTEPVLDLDNFILDSDVSVMGKIGFRSWQNWIQKYHV